MEIYLRSLAGRRASLNGPPQDGHQPVPLGLLRAERVPGLAPLRPEDVLLRPYPGQRYVCFSGI